ncbi:MAG: hypothetical protein U0836_27985 [Pirellulales bacterium]
MLFALAIAEVAVAASAVAAFSTKHGLGFTAVLPAYTHLVLAAIVIATSWVGWGASKHGLSFVTSVFSKGFFELLIDVWLVIAYFLLVKGVDTVEVPENGAARITSSLHGEALWIMVIFITYAFWDAWTKIGPYGIPKNLPEYSKRGWASIVCALLAGIAFVAFRNSTNVGTVQAVLGDSSLLMLVLLFRAMKLADYGRFTPRQRTLIASLSGAFVLLLVAALAWH